MIAAIIRSIRKSRTLRDISARMATPADWMEQIAAGTYDSRATEKARNELFSLCETDAELARILAKHKAAAALLAAALITRGLEIGQKQDYEPWLGCRAPQITFDSSDTTEHAPPTYDGKKVLLYGFYSGAFAIGPRDPPIEEAYGPLEFLREARGKSEHRFEVVGYSRGFALEKFGLAKLPERMLSLVDFPVVNLNDRHGDHSLPALFELLFSPGAGILIDTNGIVCRIYFPKMGEADFQDAATAPAWSQPVRSAPKQNKSK